MCVCVRVGIGGRGWVPVSIGRYKENPSFFYESDSSCILKAVIMIHNGWFTSIE